MYLPTQFRLLRCAVEQKTGDYRSEGADHAENALGAMLDVLMRNAQLILVQALLSIA